MHCTLPFYSINCCGSKHAAGINLIPLCLCTGVDDEKVLRAEYPRRMQPLPSCSCAKLQVCMPCAGVQGGAVPVTV